MRLTGVTSSNAYHYMKQVVRPIRGHVWHSPRTYLELKSQRRYVFVFFTECPNYLKQFCIVLLTVREFFFNIEIFYKFSENYWSGNCSTCPTGSNVPAKEGLQSRQINNVDISTTEMSLKFPIPKCIKL